MFHPHFNPHTPAGVRRVKISDYTAYYSFNPLAPHEASLPSSVYFVLSFNPRAPQGRDNPARKAKVLKAKLQSTHLPIRGATGTSPYGQELAETSIHAPLRGATAHGQRDWHCHPASIHAPRMGCDPRSGVNLIVRQHFNPRTPAGCDSSDKNHSERSCALIHAPHRGATWLLWMGWSLYRALIHAPLRGATYGPCRTT